MAAARLQLVISAAEYAGVCFAQQRESLRHDELRRQQLYQRRSANRLRLVPAAGHVSISGHRHIVLLRGGDARAVGQHQAARYYDSTHQVTNYCAPAYVSVIRHGF